MITRFFNKNLQLLFCFVLFIMTSCDEEKEPKQWIQEMEESQQNSTQNSNASNIPSLVGDWIQVKMEFSSPFNGDNIANVDFENQVIWSFSKDSIQMFEFPDYQTAHVPYTCKDNIVAFKQSNDAPNDVSNIFEQIGDTIKFTNTQGPITNYIYFLPYEEGEALAELKKNKVNWTNVLNEEWDFLNVLKYPSKESTTLDDFTPPNRLSNSLLSSSKLKAAGDRLTYKAVAGDYDLKFVEMYEWLDTFFISLEVLDDDTSMKKIIQYSRLGDVPKPFNSN